MLHVWPAEEAKAWDDLVTAQASDGGLLQSWAWGKFQEALGNAVYNLANEDKTILVQAVQLRAGNQFVLSIPRGPVCVGAPTAERLSAFVTDIKAFAVERGCFLVRFDPAFAMSLSDMLKSVGADKAKRERNPSETLIIDISDADDDIMAAMKPKWRYNVKLAEKKDVRVRFSTDEKDAETFMSLVAKTTDRQGFASYDTEYFKTLIKTLGANKQAAFAIAEFEGKPIAALLLAFCGNTAYYLHGASDYEARALMAPHLLQWASMLEAKARGCNRYDFWGAGSQWGGVTRFKQGFAPNTPLTQYVGTYEIGVKRFTYGLYRLRQLFRR